MPHTADHRAVMIRAWEIFRSTYRYPSVPFQSIGRKAFAWALRMSWHEAREAARLAAITTDAKVTMIEDLRRERELLQYADSYSWARPQIAAIDAEIMRLAA